jgi:hypothetical protein
MIKRYPSFSILALFIFYTSCGQTPKIIYNGAYIVDNKVKEQVEEKITSFNGIIFGAMDFKMFENDSLIADSYSEGKSIQCITMTTLDGDTANIAGFVGMSAAFGFKIALFKDTCIVRFFESSDFIDTTTKPDSSLFVGGSLPCKTYKLTLANKPQIKKGEIIEGVIELTTDDFYQVSNGTKTKNKVYLKGYFKTEPLQSLQDKYK